MTLQELTKIMQYAADGFGVEITPSQVAVYFDQLQKFDQQAVAAAVRECVASLERFPTVAAIRERIAKIRRLGGDPKVRANNEIARVVHDARKDGKSQDEIDELILSLERRLIVRD